MKKWFKKWFRAKKQLPIKPNTVLKFAFTDLDGKKYFTYSDQTQIPIVRLWKIEEYMIWMTRGMTGRQLDEIAEQMDLLLTDGLKTGKNAAKLGLLVNELKLRATKIAPVELMLNYLAAHYIREDEDQFVFNDQIQNEKVVSFKRGADENAGFFLLMPEYGKLCELLNITTDKWRDIENASLTTENRHAETLRITTPNT